MRRASGDERGREGEEPARLSAGIVNGEPVNREDKGELARGLTAEEQRSWRTT